MSWAEIYSSDDARDEAEIHRQGLSDALDALGSRLSRTIADAEDQVTRPINWVRENPWAALGIGLAIGFALAPRRKDSKAELLTRELEAAYLEGRRDQQAGQPVRDTSHWRARKGDLRDALETQPPGPGILSQLVTPVLSAVGGALARNLTGL